MANVDQPMIISQGMVSRSLSDAGFFQQVPEFTPFKTKLKAMHVDVNTAKPGGCGGCKQRRVEQNLYCEYTMLAQTLSPDGLARLKRYFGTQRFMVNNVEPGTNRVQLRVF